jgi:hypothetical protein
LFAYNAGNAAALHPTRQKSKNLNNCAKNVIFSKIIFTNETGSWVEQFDEKN